MIAKPAHVNIFIYYVDVEHTHIHDYTDAVRHDIAIALDEQAMQQ
jgi:hypothetical protein